VRERFGVLGEAVSLGWMLMSAEGLESAAGGMGRSRTAAVETRGNQLLRKP